MTASFSTPIMVVNKSDYYLLKESRGKSFDQSREPFYQFRILLRCSVVHGIWNAIISDLDYERLMMSTLLCNNIA